MIFGTLVSKQDSMLCYVTKTNIDGHRADRNYLADYASHTFSHTHPNGHCSIPCHVKRGRLTPVLFNPQCSPSWLYIHDHHLGRPVTRTKVIKVRKTPQKGQIHSLGKLANLN
jgi:hypothetical protein